MQFRQIIKLDKANHNASSTLTRKGKAMTTYDLKDKVALVTGANRGIGAAYVETLANAGAKKIHAAARDVNNLSALVERYPDIVEPVQLDITLAEQIAAASAQIQDLDILINNAGIVSACGTASEQTLETTRREMETNFFGPMQLTLGVTPQLKCSPQAAIINVSSIVGISNLASVSPYSISKAALHSYTQGLRAELAAENIRVIGVYPGPVDTRMTDGWEIEKATPEQIATRTLDALEAGANNVFPDNFSTQMYALFQQSPQELEKAFAAML